VTRALVAGGVLLLAVVMAIGIGSGAQGQRPAATAAAPNDSLIEAARAALAAGRPWQATRLVAPLVRDGATRSPAVTLLAATAAAEWGGWDQVTGLLGSAAWVDSLYERRGRVLLARAALMRPARAGDSTALFHARLAMQTAVDSSERSARLVLVARAFERAGQIDSARASFTRAAAALPALSDWLRLRAAALTSDSAERSQSYASLRTDAARARQPWIEAAARERFGDLMGAARAYDALEAPTAVLRLRLRMATSDSSRRAVRRELVALVRSRSGSWVAREAVALLDGAFTPLTSSEQLAVARSAAVSGPAARAASAFAVALRHGSGTERDRYTYGRVLSSLRRDREAAEQFARVTSLPLSAMAAYQRARSLVRSGASSEGRAALQKVVRTHGGDTAAASSALFLFADLATDEREDALARATFLDLARRYPTSDWAAPSRFRAAIIAFVADSASTAAEELDALRARYPRGDEASAALYWAGRAWDRAGDHERARARWRESVARHPLSYYAVLSAAQLGERGGPASPFTALGDTAPPLVPAIDSAIIRGEALERLDMRDEAEHEYRWTERAAHASQARLAATAAAFAERGMAARAIALAQKAVGEGARRDAALYRLLYPLAYRDALAAEAARHRLDASLIAALIRQESLFNPAATSRAGARGLMQVMPDVGRQVATASEFPYWADALLYQPDVSIQLGTAHLADLMGEYEREEHVLAAYNAGRSRVARWLSKRGAHDPEVFVERIPFKETRDYVRIVLRNRVLYKTLYSLEGATPPIESGASR
jgi:soluble lytic murein transglycosylase